MSLASISFAARADTATPGTVSGQFSVDATGAATYSIPFKLPPGIAGLTPHLGLAYSSRGGNGLVGIGWSLAGFSTITRCASTIAADGHTEGVTFTTDDRFCLDGNKLRLATGTYGANNATYKTELDSFAHITSYTSGGGTAPTTGPEWFKVDTPDGLTYEYGKTSNAEILAASGAAARVWALDKISDQNGNTITFKYSQDAANGSYRPSEVDYTGHGSLEPGHVVVFSYEDLPSGADKMTRYLAGTLIRQTRRLKTVSIQYNGGTVTRYTLQYDTSAITHASRLTQITECGGGLCFPPTTIAWQNGTAAWDSAVNAGDAEPQPEASHILDLNGDGCADLVYPDADSWRFRFGHTTGTFGPAHDSGRSTTTYPTDSARTIRYRGDGRASLLVDDTVAHKWVIFTVNAAGNGFDKTPTTIADSGDQSMVGVVDYNGDGLDDLMWPYDNFKIKVALNTGDGFASGTVVTSGGFADVWMFNATSNGALPDPAFTDAVADFNGDGRTDRLMVLTQTVSSQCDGDCTPHPPTVFYYWDALIATDTGYQSIGNFLITTATVGVPPSSISYPTLADVNGDGLTDVIFHGVHLSTGARSFGTGFVDVPLDTNGCNSPIPVAVGGRQMLLMDCSATWYLYRYTGNGFETDPVTTPFLTLARAADIDGDGQDELVDGSSGTWFVAKHQGVVPDLVTRITDGLGNNFEPVYKPLTDSAVYTKGGSAAYPDADIQVPLYVVSSYEANDGIGGSYTESYRYSGAQVNLHGRGFLGFAEITRTDSRNGISTATDYRQDFPFVGSASQMLTQDAGDNPISDIYFDYGKTAAGSGDNIAYFPHVTERRENEYAVGGTQAGSVVRTIKTDYTYGSHGRVTKVVTTTTGGDKTFSTQTDTIYDSDATNWCYTLPAQVTVTRGTAIRKVHYDNDTGHCRVIKKIIGYGGVLPLSIAYSYDAFGNRSQISQTGAGLSGRTTTVSYGTAGDFPVQMTNAVGQSSQTTWDRGLGVKTGATGLNGRTAHWTYDGLGRKRSETRPDNSTITWTYSGCDSDCPAQGAWRVTTAIRAGNGRPGGRRTTVYDRYGRVIQTRRPMHGGRISVVDTRYDALGRKLKQSAPYFAGGTASPYWTTYSYDLLGRVTQIDAPAADSGARAVTGYAYNGLTTTVTNAKSQTKKTKYNVLGQIDSVEDAAGSTTRYTYTLFGELESVTDAADNKTTLTYNNRGLKTAIDDPDMGHWSYEYNAAGQLTKQTDARGVVITQTYDALGRLASRTEPQPDGAPGTTHWTYDDTADGGAGQLLAVAAPDGFAKSVQYDDLGRSTDITRAINGTNYTVSRAYDGLSRVSAVTYPASIVRAADNPPTADAGADQTAVIGTSVTLDGSGTDDGQPSPLGYFWQQSAGPEWVNLSDDSVAAPTFTAHTTGFYSFGLTVGDGRKDATDSVTVKVVPATPTGLVGPASNTDGTFGLSWNAAAGATSYRIYESHGGAFVYLKTVSHESIGIDSPPRGNGDWSYYVVACASQNLCGAASSPVTVHVARPPGKPAAPSVPGNAIGPQGGATITVGWSAPTGKVTDYIVYYSTNASASDTDAASVDAGTALSKQITLTADRTTYYVWISACNELPGNCTDSDKTTTKVYIKPGAPSFTSPLPAYNTGTYTFKWKASATGHTDGYRIIESLNNGSYHDISGGNSACSVSISSTKQSGSLTCNHYSNKAFYKYHIYGKNGPAVSNGSAYDSTTVYLRPAIPSSLSVPAHSHWNGNVDLSWGSGGGYATYYQLEQGLSYESELGRWLWGIAFYAGTDTSTTIHRADGTYHFRVRACNHVAASCGGWREATSNVVVRNHPSEPGWISVSPTLVASTGTFTLSWGASSGRVTKYQLRKAVGGGSYGSPYNVGTVRSVTYNAPNVADFGWYHYQVRGCNVFACSAWRGTATVEVKYESSGGGGGGGGGCVPGDPGCGRPKVVGPTPAKTTPPAETAPSSTNGSGPLSRNESVRPEAAVPLPLPPGEGRGESTQSRQAISRRYPNDSEALARAEPAFTYDPVLVRPTAVPSPATPFTYAPPVSTWLNQAHLRTVADTATPERLTVHYYYDISGHLARVGEDLAKPYWRLGEVDPYGHAESAMLGNGVITTASYDRATGRERGVCVGVCDTAANGGILVEQYQYDPLGDLTSRHDTVHGITETAHYDPLNRLHTVQQQIGGQAATTSLTVTYDEIGNITSKTGVGTYTYSPNHPHAVNTLAGTVNTTYTYDDNGNTLTGNGKSYGWTAFNKPFEIVDTATGHKTDFWYAPNRSRYQQVIHDQTGTTTELYIGGAMTIVTGPAGITAYRHHVRVNGRTIALVTFKTDPSGIGTETAAYLHRDALGSVRAVTDQAGQVVARMSFDAFGQRRDPETLQAPEDPVAVAADRAQTFRGYTGQEQLDGVGLIHMNGRVYDPLVGRMTSADPFVQFPHYSPSLNRYSYVFNNPLTFIDPTGFYTWWQRALFGIKATGEGFVASGELVVAVGAFATGQYGPGVIVLSSSAADFGQGYNDFDSALWNADEKNFVQDTLGDLASQINDDSAFSQALIDALNSNPKGLGSMILDKTLDTVIHLGPPNDTKKSDADSSGDDSGNRGRGGHGGGRDGGRGGGRGGVGGAGPNMGRSVDIRTGVDSKIPVCFRDTATYNGQVISVTIVCAVP